jgi:integrase
MAIFKRGRTYWFHFWFNGEHVQRSTKQGNPRVARTMEAAYRTALAKGEVGIVARKPAPVLKDFAQRFIDYVQTRSAEKPKTIEFYAQQLARILDFEPLASARLDSIDESLIESFVQRRTQQVAPATVNRALATLRKLLRLAQEWRLIDRVPRIHLLPGERNREFTLSRKQEADYLTMAAQPLRDIAVLILDTGLRLGEALALQWADVHLEPASGASRGYLHVHDGKSRFARRNVPLTERTRAMLETRNAHGALIWVFSENGNGPMLASSLDHAHRKLRESLRLPGELVLHSLRHTYGTRLGEAGADAFTIMRLMGHSSVTVSQRYVHPTPEALERAVERLEGLNQRAANSLPDGSKRQLPATVSATPELPMPVSC